MEWRTLHAPVFVTFVHFSLLGVKQSLLPHILSAAFEPGALARVLGQLALITSLSACACYAARGVASSLRALRALAVFHGASVVVVPLAQAAMVARRDGEGKEEGKFDTGRGALLASRYAVLGGAMSLGGVAGATCGSLVYHRVSPAAPFVAGAVASAVGAVADGDDAPPRCGADVFRGASVLFVRPPSRRAFLLVCSFSLAHTGIAAASVYFPYFKLRFGMRQQRFAAFLTSTHLLRFVAQGLFLPALPEKLLGPRLRHRALLGALLAKAAECFGLLYCRGPGDVLALALLYFPAGLAEPLMRAELMLEIPEADASYVKGAMAVLVLLLSRGVGPYASGALFSLGAAGGRGVGPSAVFVAAGGLFLAAAYAPRGVCQRNGGAARAGMQILDVAATKRLPPARPAQPVVWCENLAKSHDGLRLQLDDASLTLREGQRCVVVGHNGCGKSTLLGVIAGTEALDGGGVRVKKGAKVTGDGRDVAAARAYAAAAAAYEADPGDAALAKRFERASDAMSDADGWAVEASVATASAKLNIDHLQGRSVAELSGGERKRVSLAGALLSGGDVLVLDEPTNHLDLWAVRWLEDYLASEVLSSKTVVFVSHDRTFAEAVATSLVELDDGGKLYEHSTRAGGLVEAYLEGKAKRLADSQSAASAARSQLRDELAWLRRGAKARQSKSTERIARVDVLQHKAEDVKQRGDLGLEAGAADDARRTEERRKRTVVTIDDLGARAGVATVDDEDYEERLFDEFSYEIAHNDRIGVVGANGAGKSTLVKAIVAQAAREGRLVGYYAQTPLSEAACAATPMDFALDVISRRPSGAVASGDLIAAASTLLKRYQFEDGAAWAAPIAKLSGGEKRRLQMMAVLDANPDVMILDEPSNDLDLGALQSLERFLSDDFKGALLLVSHDRSLLDATCDTLLVLPGDGYVSSFPGSMTEYLELLDAAPDDDDDDDFVIEALEAELAGIDGDMEAAAADTAKVTALYDARLALQARVDVLYRDWEALEALLAEEPA
ncbi:ATPase [Aureococcus anophagefferens]|nr:ATPase [Aureococcus anophagefferens]